MTKIRLISWNVNGIRAIHRKGFLDWFDEEEADIVNLQETKAKIENANPAYIMLLLRYCKFS